MKLNILKLCIGALASISLTLALTPAELNKKPSFKTIGATVNKVVEIDSTSILLATGTDSKNKPFKVVTDKDGKYLFVVTQILNADTLAPYAPPIDVSLLEGNEMFSYGNGDKVLYVFTDPECPYCKQFEQLWPSLAADYTIKVFLYNLKGHNKAVKMSEYVLSGDRAKSGDRLLEIANETDNWSNHKITKEERTKITNELNKVKKIANKISLSGTPTVYDVKGNFIADWRKIK